MPAIPSDTALAAAQPEWLIKQAASHYEASTDRHRTVTARATHRRKFVAIVADVLPSIGIEKALTWLGQILGRGSLDAECTAVVKAIAGAGVGAGGTS